MADHYADLMGELEAAEGEEQQQWIMQQIVQILRNVQFPADNVTQHIFASWKRLKRCDMKRLLIRKIDAESRILPRLRQHENINAGITVIVYGRDGKPYDLTFKVWRTCSYVLIGRRWRHFLREQALQIGDHITLWLFRQRRRSTNYHLRLVIA